MTTERFEDLYEVNLQGNYERELAQLSASIDKSRNDWQELQAAMKSTGATFSRTRKEVAALRKTVAELGEDASEVMPVQERLASSQKVLADATNRLTREQNRLNVVRAGELRVLEQAKQQQDPQIIRARAEAAAVQKLTRVLTKQAEAREFERLAKEAGLKISKDTAKAFNAEAVAAERATKAQQELAVAEKLRALGLDARGRPIAQDQPELPRSIGGQVTARGEGNARAAAQRRVDELAEKARLLEILKTNQEFLELAKNSKSVEKQLKSLTGTAEQTEGAFNRISFTFRRLIGIMAVFTAARVVVREFNNIITTAIKFNAALETTRVGMAGLIAAAGSVRDDFGQALGIDDQVLRAQNIAIDQMGKLRKDALETAASFDDLSKAFSSAVAPGIQANLTVDEIRKLTVTISQAATGLGLAQDQLAEEIRSIFQGTISARNTRIATSLGITNEDIQRAKEAGQLFEFLDKRFAAIARTGKLLMDTFTGQLSNATDAFQQLLAASSQPLFEQLKASFADLQQRIVDLSGDAVIFKPEALAAFKGLFDGLANGVQGIRAAFASIDPQGFADVLNAVGQSLGLVATTIANAFSIVFNLASPIVGVIGSIIEATNKLVTAVQQGVAGGFATAVVQGALFATKMAIALKVVTKVWTVAKALALSLRASALAMTGMNVAATATIGPLTRVQTLALRIRAAFSRLLVPLLLVAGALTAIDSLFGTEIVDSIGEFTGKIFNTLNDQLDKLIGLGGLQESAVEQTVEGTGTLVNDLRGVISALEDVGKEMAKQLRDASTELKKAKATLGLPDVVESQVSAQLDEQQKFFESVFDTNKQLEQQRKQIILLEDQTASSFRTLTDANSIADNVQQAIVQKSKQLSLERERLRSLLEIQAAEKKMGISTNLVGPASAEETQKRLKETIEAQQKVVEDLNKLEAARLKISDQHNKKQGELTAAQEILNEIQRKYNEEQEKSLAIARERVKTQALQGNFALQQSQTTFDSEIKAAQAAALAVQRVASLRADTLAKEAEAARISAQFSRVRAELDAGIVKTQQLLTAEKARGVNADEEMVSALTQQKQLLEQQLAFEGRLSQAQQARADFEARLAELRESGTSTQGIARGLETFADENDSTFNIGEQLGTDIASGLSQTLGEVGTTAIAGLFDPSINTDLGDAFGALATQLGQNLLVAVSEYLLAQLIQTLGIGIASSLAGSAPAAAAAGAAFSIPVVASGESFRNNSILSAIAITLAAKKLAAAAAAMGAASGNPVGAAAGVAAVAAAHGGRVDRLRTVFSPATSHQHARGFARGGRPLGIDGRDTIPAWLRRGEWVIRPESVRKAEKSAPGFMDALNRGQINFEALPGIAGASRGRSPAAAAPRRSFATGGPVGGPSSRDGGQPQVVLQFNDEQTMDRALAAGSKSALRFARMHRQQYRAALGFEN